MLGRRAGSWVVGVLAFQDIWTIERWKRSRACSRNCNLWSWEEMWRMFWAGKKVGMTLFLLDPSTAPSWEPLVILFLGVLFRGLGLRWGWVFLLRKRLGTKFRPSISSKGGDEICQIGATCVKRKRKLVTIESCFARRLQCYGVWSSLFLVCNGSCIPRLKGICLVGMALLWARKGKRHGRLPLYA